jgi:hypothetical protein
MRAGGIPAGSSRALRLDPFALPVSFAAPDAVADEKVREVEIHPERIVLRRALRGMRMALNLPVSAYLGVALKMLPPQEASPGLVMLSLEHRDPSLSIPLCMATDGGDIAAEWQSWSRVLRRPLLVADADGSLRQPFPHLGAVRIATPSWRRRRRGALRRRRPSILMRRTPGRAQATPAVHRGEREIIARD